jgi:hypothetical protein
LIQVYALKVIIPQEGGDERKVIPVIIVSTADKETDPAAIHETVRRLMNFPKNARIRNPVRGNAGIMARFADIRVYF